MSSVECGGECEIECGVKSSVVSTLDTTPTSHTQCSLGVKLVSILSSLT